MNQIVVKDNKPLRYFAGMMLVLLLVSHFMGQVDLTRLSFLWLMIAMAINAIQATFTGFCPMFKNARGECVACGVVCDSEACDATKDAHEKTDNDPSKENEK